MYFLMNNVDLSDLVDFSSVQVNMAMSDPLPTAQFDVYDAGSKLTLHTLQEVVIFDETLTSQPTHNLLVDPLFAQSLSGSSAIYHLGGGGAIDGTGIYNTSKYSTGATGIVVTGGSGSPVTFTASSASVGYAYLFQICPAYLVAPGVTYMFSTQMKITAAMTNCSAFIEMQFVDASGAVLRAPSVSQNLSTPVGTQQQVAVQATAPSNAAALIVQFGIQVTAASASGTVQFTSVQAEPMWYVKYGQSYPTAQCAPGSSGCTTLPNGTNVRQSRVFTGYANDIVRVYDGPNRVQTVKCSGIAMLLDTTQLVNASYEQQNDSTILQSILSQYFGGLITGNHIVTGTLIDSFTSNDLSIKEVLQSLCDSSGFTYYIDPYYDLHYIPPYYEQAAFGLSDSPDSVTTFAYYEYQSEEDATQMKNRVKVSGGKYNAPAINDTLTGDGRTTVFPLTQQPTTIFSFVVGAVSQKAFFAGSGPKLGVGGYQVSIDKTQQTMTFATAPGVGVTGTINYTYETDVLVRESELQSYALYGRYFDSKVNDTSLLSPATAALRALAELVNYAYPRYALQFKTYAPMVAGVSVPLTHTLDGFNQMLFLVQRVTLVCLGGGVFEYQVEAGAYNPDIIDIIKHLHKAINRQTSTAGSVLTQENLAAIESLRYSDTITQNTGAGTSVKYGTGKYAYGQYS